MCNGPVVGSWKPSVAGAREEEGAGQVDLSYLGRGWGWRGSRGRFCVRGADVTGALKRLSISRCTVSLTGPGPDFGRIRLLSPPPPSEDAWQTRRMAQVAWRPASAAQRLQDLVSAPPTGCAHLGVPAGSAAHGQLQNLFSSPSPRFTPSSFAPQEAVQDPHIPPTSSALWSHLPRAMQKNIHSTLQGTLLISVPDLTEPVLPPPSRRPAVQMADGEQGVPQRLNPAGAGG